jgi:hypothetical protein
MRIEADQLPNQTDRRRWVIGVDTHTDTHAAALLDGLGAVCAQTEVTADPDGYAGLLAWAGDTYPPDSAWSGPSKALGHTDTA